MATTTDYDSDLAGDTVTATAKKKQTSFDQTNLPAQYQQPAPTPAATSTPAGPVGRAALQLPETSVTAPGTASPASPASPMQSLESLRPTGIGDGRSAIYAGVGANGEASFSNLGSTLNTLSKNFTAPNQSPDQRMSAMPGLNPPGGGVQQPAQRYPTSLADLSPAGPSTVNAAQPAQRTASLTDALPGYTPTPTQSPVAQQQASLADAWRGGSSSGPGFAVLGSSANMGDGVGTFSQANQGDAQLAMGRFQKAADLREGFKAQDRLDQALGAKWQADHTNVVHDSSRPVTTRELKTDAAYEQMRNGAARNVDLAQGYLDAQRQGVAADQQQRQANRLEDALTMATAPNATDAARQTYLTLTDPDGSKALARQLTQAQIDASKERANKDRSLADSNDRKVKGLPAGLQKLEDDDVQAIGSTKTINGALDRVDSQIADGSLVLGPWANAVSATRNAIGASDESSTNYASFLATLEKLRNDSLRLNKGTQTEGDADRAWNELFTNIKDPKIVQQRIKEIKGYNDSAAQLNVAKINNRRKNQGLDELNVDELLAGTQRPAATQATESQGQQQANSSQRPIFSISTADQYARLPSGTDFIDPQGNHRRKP